MTKNFFLSTCGFLVINLWIKHVGCHVKPTIAAIVKSLDGPSALCCAVLSFYRWLFMTCLLIRWCVFGLVANMMILCIMCVWHVFACWCNMLSVSWRWLKKIRKIRSHDQNDGEPNWYMSSMDMHDRQNASRVLSHASEVTGPLRLWWHWALEADHGPSPVGGSYSLLGCFSMSSCEMLRWWLHLEILIRFYPL
jgi:hypothetical protein